MLMIKQILAMKSFENSNYYELLDIQPNVLQFQIRRAYRKALELYRQESMASYSLFSDSRRKQILAMLEDAFTTLIDRDSRYKYDLQMVKDGFITREELSAESKALALVRERKEAAEKVELTAVLSKCPKAGVISTSALSGILEKDTLVGDDLKRIREELGVSLKEMSEHTKIRVALLKAIENDEYDKLPSRFHLRSFLKAYVDCLVVDADVIVERYLKRIDD
ncbi:MAG: helix-turn-helix domain-containing protein [Deltaproteobacteria bacterium]|nr:helix-turn-helix domain-containing protein [Deltaproteobacteria bacterium]MBW2596496.1 helix-turn-helix domain-containing protein [Deltaproteobacteria bacterium]